MRRSNDSAPTDEEDAAFVDVDLLFVCASLNDDSATGRGRVDGLLDRVSGPNADNSPVLAALCNIIRTSCRVSQRTQMSFTFSTVIPKWLGKARDGNRSEERGG